MDFTISPSLQVKMRSSLHTEFLEINVSSADLKNLFSLMETIQICPIQGQIKYVVKLKSLQNTGPVKRCIITGSTHKK